MHKFSCYFIDNGGKKQFFTVKAKTKPDAIEKAFKKARKGAKGTIVNVFWVGERPTYRSRNYDWLNETETVAGAYTEDGRKVWIKADYLKVVDGIKSPDRRNRDLFIRNYVERNVPLVVRNAARGMGEAESR